MTDWNTLTTALSPICGIVVLLMGIYAYYRNPKMESTQAFLLVTCIYAVGGTLDFLFLNAPDEGTASILARMELFTIVVLFAAVLYLATFLPYEKYSGWFRRNKREYAVIAVLSGYASIAALGNASKDASGWVLSLGQGFINWSFFFFSYIVITIYMLTTICLSTKERLVRRQCTLMSVAAASPAVYAFGLLLLNALGYGVPRALSPGFILFAIIFLYAVLRYSPFSLPRGSNEIATEEEPVQIAGKEQTALLVEEKQPSTAYALLNERARQGSACLLVTRTHPQVVKEQYKVEAVPMLWLATQAGPGRLDPANLSILQHNITEFLRRNRGGTVMLDGIEYLLTENPPEKVVRLMQSLRDEVIVNGALFIIPVDPKALDEKRMSMLEREFEVLVPKEGAGTEI